MSKQQKHYVVYCCEHLRDGIEECAKIFPTLKEAMEKLNEWGNGWGKDNYELRLFELGKEIILDRKIIKKVEEKIQERTEFKVKE